MVGKTSGFGSPQSDYTEQILLPFLQRRLGLNITLDVARRGYQANGGGIVIADVSPVRGPIPAVDLLERGAIVSIKGRAYASGFGEELADRIRTTATLSLVMADINPDIIDIKAAQEPFLTTVGRGSGLVLWAETKNGCVIGGSSVGLEHPNPKVIGRTAVTTLLKNLQHGGCVDEYLQVSCKPTFHISLGMTIFVGSNDRIPCPCQGQITNSHRAIDFIYKVCSVFDSFSSVSLTS